MGKKPINWDEKGPVVVGESRGGKIKNRAVSLLDGIEKRGGGWKKRNLRKTKG